MTMQQEVKLQKIHNERIEHIPSYRNNNVKRLKLLGPRLIIELIGMNE